MKYLVLGSSGQVGLELCKFLKKEGHEVVEFDIVADESQDLRIPNVLDEIHLFFADQPDKLADNHFLLKSKFLAEKIGFPLKTLDCNQNRLMGGCNQMICPEL